MMNDQPPDNRPPRAAKYQAPRMIANGGIKSKSRPAAPPPPPPPRVAVPPPPTPPKPARNGPITSSARTDAPSQQQRFTADTVATTAAARIYSLAEAAKHHRPGATVSSPNNRSQRHFNGHSVVHGPPSRSQLAKTYEVFQIQGHHHQLGVPYPAPPRYNPSSSYSYFPHQSHSGSSKSGSNHGASGPSVADLSQGSCDNTPATPDSLDSLVGSGEDDNDEDDSVVSSPLHRLTNQSDDACSSDRIQCTSSVLSPLSTDEAIVDDNTNTIKRRNGNDQQDNLIEELTTLIPRPTTHRYNMMGDRTPSPQVSSTPSSPPLSDNRRLGQAILASSEADENSSTSRSSSTASSLSPSIGRPPSMSSSQTPSTVVATVVLASSEVSPCLSSSPSNITSTLVGPSSSSTPIIKNPANASPTTTNSSSQLGDNGNGCKAVTAIRTYYFDGDSGGLSFNNNNNNNGNINNNPHSNNNGGVSTVVVRDMNNCVNSNQQRHHHHHQPQPRQDCISAHQGQQQHYQQQQQYHSGGRDRGCCELASSCNLSKTSQYEQMTATMLRRSRSQQLQQPPRSVGNTPPLPTKHMNICHYMPLQAYQNHARHLPHQCDHDPQQQQQQQHQARLLRRSNPQLQQQPPPQYQTTAAAASEYVLTPRQAQQLQHSLVNRYATIGRNYHINANVSAHDPTKFATQEDCSQAPPHTSSHHRSDDNLAMRINTNLTSCQNMTMRRSKPALDEAPLANIKRLQHNNGNVTPSLSASKASNQRLQQSYAEDIVSADSTTECCDDDSRLSNDDDYVDNKEAVDKATEEEDDEVDEKVRKHTLISTLLMPRPQRKPPFTIESAMNKIMRRKKKTEKKDEEAAADDAEADDEDAKKKPPRRFLINGRRRKDSPAPLPPVPVVNRQPKLQAQPKERVEEKDDDTGYDNNGSVVKANNNSLVTKLRQAGSDRERELLKKTLASGLDPPSGLDNLRSGEEATLPDSDSEVAKKMKRATQISTSSGNGSSDSPLISKDPSPSSLQSEEEDEDDDDDNDEEEDDADREEDTPEHEMEYCDPCFCYGKCCLDIVASIFCVSLL